MYAKYLFLALLVLMPFTASAEKWRDPVWRDMFNQPNFKNQEAPRNLPKDSVPSSGKTAMVPFKFDPRLDRMVNPVTEPTVAQQQQGKFLFETYCFPCHGMTAQGDGPVSLASKGTLVAPSLINDFYRTLRSDAFIWYTVLKGGPIMPPHEEAISQDDAWLIVNHIRSLQKQ